MERKNVWKEYDAQALDRLEAFAKDYRAFLDNGKTERECTAICCAEAEKRGFLNLDTCVAEKRQLKAGDRVYCNWMDKAFLLFVIGKQPMEQGMNILGAHIDSPRIDVKQNPLYEDSDLAYLDTHYYGGIKKYQWVAQPLSLHGVIVKKDGTRVNVVIGEDANDPVFCISDLLPHLAQDQMKRDASKLIEGEELDLIVGGRPVAGCDKDAVKQGVLNILK